VNIIEALHGIVIAELKEFIAMSVIHSDKILYHAISVFGFGAEEGAASVVSMVYGFSVTG
jgi:hypothetical protein